MSKHKHTPIDPQKRSLHYWRREKENEPEASKNSLTTLHGHSSAFWVSLLIDALLQEPIVTQVLASTHCHCVVGRAEITSASSNPASATNMGLHGFAKHSGSVIYVDALHVPMFPLAAYSIQRFVAALLFLLTLSAAGPVESTLSLSIRT